jgi:hypothetical protein
MNVDVVLDSTHTDWLRKSPDGQGPELERERHDGLLLGCACYRCGKRGVGSIAGAGS